MTDETGVPAAPDPSARSSQNGDGLKDAVALWVTLGLLLAFGAFIVYLSRQADSVTEVQWQRQIFLFQGVEAIVFAAIGWLFGREVSRKQAEHAESRAETAEVKAEKASEALADTSARAAAVKAAIKARVRAQHAEDAEETGLRSRSLSPAASAPRSSGLEELSNFVDIVLPD